MKESELKLPYGIKNGQLIHISSVQISGLKCNCTCPSCNGRLVANMGRKIKNGKKRRDYFSHYKTSDCKTGLETAIHLLAKDIFRDRKAIRIPPLISYITEHGGDVPISPSRLYEFDEVLLEQRQGEIIPDIILIKGEVRLLVEIAFTHFIDEAKRERIQNLGISTIEIDIGSILKAGVTHEQFPDYLVEGETGKSWIYNARHEQLKTKYLKDLAIYRAKEEQIRQAREAKLRLHLIPVEKVHSSNQTFKRANEFHTEWCPLYMKYYLNSHLDPKRANVEIDCRKCKMFKGYRDERRNIVCLATEELRTMNPKL